MYYLTYTPKVYSDAFFSNFQHLPTGEVARLFHVYIHSLQGHSTEKIRQFGGHQGS